MPNAGLAYLEPRGKQSFGGLCVLATRAENMHFPCPEWEPTATIGTAGYPVAAVFPLWIAPKSGQPQTQGLEEASRRLRRTGCCPGQRPTRKRFAIGTSSSLSSRRWGSWEEPSQVSFLGQFGWSSTDSRQKWFGTGVGLVQISLQA